MGNLEGPLRLMEDFFQHQGDRGRLAGRGLCLGSPSPSPTGHVLWHFERQLLLFLSRDPEDTEVCLRMTLEPSLGDSTGLGRTPCQAKPCQTRAPGVASWGTG